MSLKDLKIEYIKAQFEDEVSGMLSVHKHNFVQIGDKKWFMPYKYAEIGDKLYNFETRPDDTWIVTFPRSGTTVTQELIWLVVNDLNFDEAHRTNLFERFPYIDMGVLFEDHTFLNSSASEKLEKHSIEYVRDMPSPRFIKSHMPLDLLPTVVNGGCKIIYVARNPKDVVVSAYNFSKDYKYANYKGTLELFCDTFINNHHHFTPYWEHVKTAWNMRHRTNVLFLLYEDLRKDLFGTIKKVAAFFDKTYSDEQIAKLMDHLNIDNFRKNAMVNQLGPDSPIKPEQFIRQGKINNWKETLTPEIDEKFNKWIADNLKDTDLKVLC